MTVSSNKENAAALDLAGLAIAARWLWLWNRDHAGQRETLVDMTGVQGR